MPSPIDRVQRLVGGLVMLVAGIAGNICWTLLGLGLLIDASISIHASDRAEAARKVAGEKGGD